MASIFSSQGGHGHDNSANPHCYVQLGQTKCSKVGGKRNVPKQLIDYIFVTRVSYVSLLDIWMVVCIFFVFLSIGEFILVSAMTRNGLKVSKMQSFSALFFSMQKEARRI